MLKKLEMFSLIFILAGAFFVRLYKIDNPVADWHSWRQADTASVTRIYVDYGIDLLRPRYHDLSNLQTGLPNPEGWRFVEFPIYNALHAQLVQVFPQYSLEIWGRLLSAFCSLVSIIFIYLISRRFLGSWGGLISAFLFAFMPFNIYFSRVILPEPMSVMFVLSSIYFFIRWFDKNKNYDIIFSALLFSLALLVKPYTVFYAVVLIWLAINKHEMNLGNLIKDKVLWIFAAIVITPVIGWRLWMLQYPEGIPFYKWVFNLFGIRFRPSFWYWIFGERLGHMVLGSWGIFLFLPGLLAKVKSSHDLWIAQVFALSAFAYVVTIAAANVRHDYYQTLIIPAVVLVLTRGILFLWEEYPRLITRLTVLVTLVFTIYFPWMQIKGFYQINNPQMITAGQKLDEIASKDSLVVAPLNGDTAFLYQTKRSGWPIQVQPVEELVTLGADYYVSLNLNDSQTKDAMRKFEIPIQTEEYVIIDLNKKRMPKN